MFFQRLFTRILFSLFTGSFVASIAVFAIQDISFTWIMVLLWSWSLLMFLLLSRYAKKKMAQQEAEIEHLLKQRKSDKKKKGKAKPNSKKQG